MNGCSIRVAFVTLFILHQALAHQVCRSKHESEGPCEDCLCEDGKEQCEKCSTPCVRYKEFPCEHGRCVDDRCLCDPCWGGESCGEPDNKFAPQFTKEVYEIHLKSAEKFNIITIKAIDEDAVKCKTDDCPCANVEYSIKNGNDAALFAINKTTGEISYHPENGFATSQVHLTVAASNPYDSSVETTAEVAISFAEPSRTAGAVAELTGRRLLQDQDVVVPGFGRDSPEDDPLTPKIRHKRAVSLPSTVQFGFNKVVAATKQVKIGNKLDFTFNIFMPKTKSKMKCELFAPRNTNNVPIFALSKVKTTIGTNIPIKPASTPWIYSSSDGGNQYDQAKIDFGEVENKFTDTNNADQSKMKFTFSAVVIRQVVNAQVYYVSAGCSYKGKEMVWVGQAVYKGVVDNTSPQSTKKPMFALEGPQEAPKNKPITWTISATLFDMYNDVTLLVEPHQAKEIKLVRVQVLSAGENYPTVPVCVGVTQTDASNSTLEFKLGRIVNTGFRAQSYDTAKNTIKFSVLGYLKNTDDVVVGTQYSIFAGINLDSKKLWVAEKRTKAQAAVANTCSSKKPSFALWTSHKQVIPGAWVAVIVNITTPADTVDNYVYHASLPYNGTSQMSTDSKYLSVYYTGANTPGFEADSTNVKLTSEGNNENKDYAEWDLGTIRNFGGSTDPASNTIRISLLAKLLPTEQTKLLISVGVRYCKTWIWVAQVSFDVVQAIPAYVKPQLINFVLRSPMRHSVLYKNGIYTYWLDVHIPPGTMYKPLTTDIAGPYYDNKALLGICKAEILHFGKNIKMYDAAIAKPNYVSTGGDGVNDRAYFTFGLLSNVGKEDAEMFWMDNIIRISVEVYMTEHDTTKKYTKDNSSPYCMVFGNRFSKVSLWVGNSCLQLSKNLPTIKKGETEPTFQQKPLKSSPKVKFGAAYGFDLTMQIPYGTSAAYTVSALTSSTILSVCRITVKRKGSNIPCLPQVARFSWSKTYVNQSQINMVQLTIGSISNIGTDPKTKADATKNSITVVTAGYLKPDMKSNPKAAAGTKHFLAGAVKISNNRIWIETAPLEADHGALSNTWEATFATSTRTTGNKVVLGGGIVMTIKINIPAAKTSEFQVDVTTDKGTKTSICDMKLVSAGYNLPCVNGTACTLKLTSSNNNVTFHKASLEIGLVSNMAETTDTAHKDNQLQIEVVAFVPKGAGAVSGDKFKLTAAAKYADKGTVTVGTPVEIEVTDKLLDYQKDMRQVAHLQPLDLVPTVNFNNRTVWILCIMMTEMTAEYTIKIESELVGGKAVIAFDRVRLEKVGGSIAYCGKEEMKFESLTPSSAASTTQMTKVIAVTPKITSTGILYRSEWNKNSGLDNSFCVAFETVICEDDTATANSIVKFTTQVLRFEKVVAKFERQFKRDITPKVPEVSLNMTVENKGTILSGQDLKLVVAVNHTLKSTAWARNVIATVMIPSFTKYKSIVSVEPKLKAATVKANEVKVGVELTIPLIYFVDTYKVVLSIAVDPNKVFEKGSPDALVTIAADAIFTGKAATPKYASKMSFTNFTFGTEACNSNLGVEDSTKVKNCQISGSTIAIDGKARSPFVLPKRPGFKEYIQVNFGNQVAVSSVTIIADPADKTNYVNAFQLQYSEEGMLWHYVDDAPDKPKTFTIASLDKDKNYAVVALGEKRFKGRYVRLLPTKTSKQTDTYKLGIKLNGCAISSDVKPEDICKSTTPSTYLERSYIVDPSTCELYVCTVPEVGKLPVCSFTADMGKSWTPVDDNVVNIQCLEQKKDLGSNRPTIDAKTVGLAKNLDNVVTYDQEYWSRNPVADCSKLNQAILVKHKPILFVNTLPDKPETITAEDTWKCPTMNVAWGVTKKGLYVKGTDNKWSTSCVASFGEPCK